MVDTKSVNSDSPTSNEQLLSFDVRYLAVDTIDLDAIETTLFDLVASQFHEHENGVVSLVWEYQSQPTQTKVSFAEWPSPRPKDVLYLCDIAQVLDDCISWLKKPGQQFSSIPSLSKLLTDPVFSGSFPATKFGYSGSPNPLKAPSHQLLFDHRRDLYQIATKLLGIVQSISRYYELISQLNNHQLEGVIGAINQASTTNVSRHWNLVSSLATAFQSATPGSYFISVAEFSQPISGIDVKKLLKAFAEKSGVAADGLPLPADSDLATNVELAQITSFDQQQVASLIFQLSSFYTAVATPEEKDSSKDEKNESRKKSVSETDDTLEAAAPETSPEQESPAPQETDHTSIKDAHQQLRETASRIVGITSVLLFSQVGIDPKNVPVQLQGQILTEAMALLSELSPSELRSPATRHQILDKVLQRLQRNATFSAQLQLLYAEHTQDAAQAKELAKELDKRAAIADANNEQRQRLAAELEKPLPELAEASAAFPGNFAAKMSEFKDEKQQSIGPNTAGYKQIVTAIDQLILLNENPSIIQYLSTAEFNSMFGVSLAPNQADAIRSTLESYWWLRVGQLSRVYNLADLSRNLAILSNDPNGGLSKPALEFRIRSRLRELETLRSPNLPFAKFDSEALLLAAAADKQQYRRITLQQIGIPKEQLEQALDADEASLITSLNEQQLKQLTTNEQIRQAVINQFLSGLSQENRERVFLAAEIPTGTQMVRAADLYKPSLMATISMLQEEATMAESDALMGKTRKSNAFSKLLGLRGNDGFQQTQHLTGKIATQGATYAADILLPGSGATIRTFITGMRVIGLGPVADRMERYVGLGMLGGIGAFALGEMGALYFAAKNLGGKIGYFLGNLFSGGGIGATPLRLGGAYLGSRLWDGAKSLPKDAWNAIAGNDGTGGGPTSPNVPATPQNLVNPTPYSQATQAAGNAARLLGTTGGQIFTASVGAAGTIGVITIMTLGNAFLTPLPTLDSLGEVSKYVSIQKQAYLGTNAINTLPNFSEPLTIRYEITVSPKDGYVLTIDNATDVLSYTFTEENQSREKRILTREQLGLTADNPTRVLDLGDTNPDNDVWVITYEETIQPLSDASIRNTLELQFTAAKEGEETVTDKATNGFKICVGECPQNEGDGCWPVTGSITQEPYGAASHSLTDAVDIGYRGDKDIRAPYSGYACFYKIGTGLKVRLKDGTVSTTMYGNHVVIGSEDFALVYGHLHSINEKFQYGQCADVEAGERLGIMGTTGNSTGVHLHYEVRIRSRNTNNEFSSYTSAIPGQPGRRPTLLETLVPGQKITYPYKITDRCEPAHP